MLLFWVVTLFRLVIRYQRFGGIYCLHLQDLGLPVPIRYSLQVCVVIYSSRGVAFLFPSLTVHRYEAGTGQTGDVPSYTGLSCGTVAILITKSGAHGPWLDLWTFFRPTVDKVAECPLSSVAVPVPGSQNNDRLAVDRHHCPLYGSQNDDSLVVDRYHCPLYGSQNDDTLAVDRHHCPLYDPQNDDNLVVDRHHCPLYGPQNDDSLVVDRHHCPLRLTE
jgi:hypothetical protein